MVSHQDYLSEVLETFPLEMLFAGRIHASVSWGFSVPEGTAMVCSVVRGSCLTTADTHVGEIVASSGDLLFLSPGAEHRLQEQAGSPVEPLEKWMQTKRSGDPLVLSLGDTAPASVFHLGIFRLEDPQIHPFYWGLPPIVHLPKELVQQSPPLRRLLCSIDEELSDTSPGRLSIVKRLVDILFIETARFYLARIDDTQEESSAGQFLHPDLGPALTLMHRHPERSWTVAELAEQVAMSRSAFATAFVKVLGRPPVAYLRERRMLLAERLLKNRSLGLKEIAQRVGYDSVSAFNSAFKQWCGTAPGRYRNQMKSY